MILEHFQCPEQTLVESFVSLSEYGDGLIMKAVCS